MRADRILDQYDLAGRITLTHALLTLSVLGFLPRIKSEIREECLDKFVTDSTIDEERAGQLLRDSAVQIRFLTNLESTIADILQRGTNEEATS